MRGSIQARPPSRRWERATALRYATLAIQAGEHVITAASPLLDELR